jgi:hypothetical protein
MKKSLATKGNAQKNEKEAYGTGENIYKIYI